jgi:hypothetical protein
MFLPLLFVCENWIFVHTEHNKCRLRAAKILMWQIFTLLLTGLPLFLHSITHLFHIFQFIKWRCANQRSRFYLCASLKKKQNFLSEINSVYKRLIMYNYVRWFSRDSVHRMIECSDEIYLFLTNEKLSSQELYIWRSVDFQICCYI